MKSEDAAQAYLAGAIENAPPIKIVRMLYQGALRFLAQALEQDAEDTKSKFIELVNRVDAIVIELRCALDHDADPEVSAQLEQLYLFAESRLGVVLIERTKEPLLEVRQVLETLLEAWNHVELVSAQEQ